MGPQILGVDDDHATQTRMVDDNDDLMHREYPRAVRAEAHSETVGVTACCYMLLFIAL